MRLQHAPCGYFAFDDARRITAANDEALRYLGYDSAQLLGQPLSLLLPPAVRILFHTNVYPVLAEGGRVEEVYALLRCHGGDDLPVLLNAARSRRDGAFQTDCIFLAVKRRNLFERHLERLEVTKAALELPPESARTARERTTREAGERMAMLGLLLAGLMHEVRNPLSYVVGNLDLLSLELDKPEPQSDQAAVRECVAEAKYGAARVFDLVRAVGMVSRIDDTGPVPVDIGRVVESAVRLVQHRVTSCAKLQVDSPCPGPTVLGDEARLAQVVMNLLVNAAQALEASKTPDARVSIQSALDQECAVIAVSDNGPGVPAELRDRIFEPFYTTKPIGEGTGLGLPISRQIITSFGGSLDLLCPPEGGATFRIVLPIGS